MKPDIAPRVAMGDLGLTQVRARCSLGIAVSAPASAWCSRPKPMVFKINLMGNRGLIKPPVKDKKNTVTHVSKKKLKSGF